ncbi:MAG: hypothetical protein PHU25_18040 [Deltaproteobacteria bacterium]|nr:hypothetical protein [Deltaproteobacteria bacterium]
MSPGALTSARLQAILVPLAVIFAVAAAYGRAPFLPYVWDDNTIGLPEMAAGRGPTLAGVLERDLYSVNGLFYRPLASVTLWLETRAGAASPTVGHILNLALHLGSLAILMSLALRLGAGPLGAGLAGLWWGMNPLQTEAVCWISSRADLLCTLLVLAATRVALARGLRSSGVIAGLLCALAPLAKETGMVALPVALALSLAAPEQRTSKRQVVALAAVGLAGLAADFVLRRLAGIAAMGASVGPPGADTALDFLAVAARLAAWGAVPFNLSIAHEHLVPPPLELWLPGAACIAALAAVAIRRWRTGVFLPAALLLAALVSLVPVVFGARATAVLSERYAHLPLALLALLALSLARGTTFASLPARRTRVAAAIFALVIALFFVPVVVTRAENWTSNRDLFASALVAEPDSSEAARLYGLLAAREDDCNVAVRLLKIRVAAVPNDAATLVALAACENALGYHDEALVFAQRARAISPEKISAWLQSAVALAMLDRPDEALALLDTLERTARARGWPLNDRCRRVRDLATRRAAARP